MADWFTIIVVILLVIALIVTNIYVLAYFCHPDDKGSCLGWVMKVIVIIGLTLSWIQVLLLPLDVSNHRTFGGGLNMKLFWYIIYILTIIYILVISPISSSYYEADPSWSIKEKITHSLCWFFIYFAFFLLITIILYASIGKADIPIKGITCNYLEGTQNSYSEFDSLDNCQSVDGDIQVKVNFLIYAIAVLLFVSWLLFAFFGGIGLAAVPIDLFCAFKKRPKHMKSKEIDRRKTILLKNVEELRLLGQEVKRLEEKGDNKRFKLSSKRRNYDRKYSQFRAGYMLIDEEYKIVNAGQEARKKGNCVIVFYYLLIPLGILAMICTLLWMIQFVCSYFIRKNGRPGYPFLARMYIFLNDHHCAFLSFLIFSLLSLYLLLCVIKGNFKFGVRFLCCWEIFPMKKDGTYMNSFVFNTTLILLASCSITQFCADCLEDYVAFTDINIIFNVQIRYLKFFKFFYKYHIFQYILFAVFVISLIYLLIRPSDSINKVLKNSPDVSNNISGNDLNMNNTDSSLKNNTLPKLKL
jgi:LMBR1 domain-containing protein 1